MKQLRMLSIVMKLVQLPTGGNVMRSLPMISLLLALVLASCKPVTPQAAQLGSQLSLAQPGADKIVNAMSGGLPSFARNATILDWPAKKGAAPVKLRDGTNGWVCRPDDPTTPTNDPRCFEPNWLKLFGKPFDTSREAQKAFGIGYMLQGGSAADNFDLKAIEPATGQDWVIDGPHVMLIFSSDKTSAAFSTEHHTGGPYMMFKGSPSEHLMIPTLADAVPSKNDPIRNAISAAPLKIAENAAIMDWPKKAGDDLVRPEPFARLADRCAEHGNHSVGRLGPLAGAGSRLAAAGVDQHRVRGTLSHAAPDRQSPELRHDGECDH